jgi:hypothetical protein
MIERVSPDIRLPWSFLAAGLAALWMDCGTLHSFQSADSILTVLISLQRWTPFFWGQDRFGMLTPLLAAGIHHPLANMLFQGWLTCSAALLVPYLLSWYLSCPNWFAVGSAANALMISMFSQEFLFDWFVTQPYAMSMCLALCALVVNQQTGPVRTFASIVLLALAHWVNLGVIMVIGPLIILRGRHVVHALVHASVGTAAGFLIKGLSTAPPTTTEILSPAAWPAGWMELARTLSTRLAHPRAMAIVVIIALGSAALATSSGWSYKYRTPAVITITVAILHWLIIGVFRHVQLNVYYPRYVLPSVILAIVSIALMMAWVFDLSAVAHRRASLMTTGLLSIALVLTFGMPSVARLNRVLDERFGQMTPVVITAGATVIVGDYWTVWPAVFHANLSLARHGIHSSVFGFTHRSEATNPLWLASARVRPTIVAGKASDLNLSFFLGRLGVPVQTVGDPGPVMLYRTHPSQGAASF